MTHHIKAKSIVTLFCFKTKSSVKLGGGILELCRFLKKEVIDNKYICQPLIDNSKTHIYIEINYWNIITSALLVEYTLGTNSFMYITINICPSSLSHMNHAVP